MSSTHSAFIVDVHLIPHAEALFALRDRLKLPKSERLRFQQAMFQGGAVWKASRGAWTVPPFRAPMQKVLSALHDYRVYMNPDAYAKLDGLPGPDVKKRASVEVEERFAKMLRDAGFDVEPGPR